MNKKAVGSMSEWSGMLRDFFRQINDGSITIGQLQKFLEHKDPFKRAYLIEWEKFYRELFREKINLSDISIPEKRQGFDRLIIVARGMTPQGLYDKCKELFPCWKWTSKDLDGMIKSERTTDQTYAVWFRDRTDSDKELNALTAEELKRQDMPGITLEERLIYELKYFKETGQHLDTICITFCSGSRRSNGDVPCVNWYQDRMWISWRYSNRRSDRLRPRQASL